jgi:hypothetical protein
MGGGATIGCCVATICYGPGAPRAGRAARLDFCVCRSSAPSNPTFSGPRGFKRCHHLSCSRCMPELMRPNGPAADRI